MITTSDLGSFNLFSLRAAYLNRSITVWELIDAVLHRAEHFKQHNIWISLLGRDTLLAEAKKLEACDPALLPLYGIPFAIKDNIDYSGLPTTAACPGFSYLLGQTAFAVRLLVEAGAMLIGKTNMDQFATGLRNSLTRALWHLQKRSESRLYFRRFEFRFSSAVALNIVSFALGTDTAGSGRIPVAFNNIVGVKPTRGLISCSGVVPACRSLDCVSLFSRSVAEAEYLLDIVNAADKDDVYARCERGLLETMVKPEAKLRFGIPKPHQLNFFGDVEGARLFKEGMTTLQTMGAVVEVDLQPLLEAAALLYDSPWIAERYAGIRNFIEAHPDQLHPVTRQILLAAKEKTAITVLIPCTA